jgi:predicted dehydrogenase
MMRVTVIGQGERAEAHRAWYRHAGVELAQAIGDDARELPAAAIYDLCAEPEERQHLLGLVLRRPRAAVLLAGRVAATADGAARLVAAGRRRRCVMAVTGGTRFVPALARLRELACGGTLGTVREARLQVTTAPALAAEAWFAGLDLGLWLADEASPVADSATLNGMSFQAGEARVTVEVTVEAGRLDTAWRVAIAADLGQAVGNAVFRPGLPGQGCRDQALVVTRSGRQRRLELPEADPAGNELAAVLARLAAGLPWLALCMAERAAGLLAVLEAGAGKVSAARVGAS